MIMARRDPTRMVMWGAFIVFAGVLVVIMSLERILGRPIPPLRDSLPVIRNRAFSVVLIAMAASFYVVLSAILARPVCYDGCGYSYAELSILAFSSSAAIGWVVFAVLWIGSVSERIIRDYISG
jgi:hypothetical protein